MKRSQKFISLKSMSIRHFGDLLMKIQLINSKLYSKILLVTIGWAGVAFDFTSSLITNQQKILLVTIGLVFTSSHPEQRS